MNPKQIKNEFGDCDWLRKAFPGYSYAADAVLWLMNRVEELEQYTKEDKGDKTMSVENCSVKQVKKGQVIEELDNAEEAANRLVTKVDTLETQLHVILKETTPLPCPENKEQVEAVLVPLANRVRSHYLLLRNLGNRFEEILERLEIR